MFKFELDQTVWYFKNNSVHSAPILSRKYVDNVFSKKERCTDIQEEAFSKLGNECIRYATIHSILNESEVFESKEALLNSL